MRTQACEATRLRGEQSEALLDLRMACLDRRLQEMGALAAAIDGPKALRAAGQGVQQLAPLSLCTNAQALQAVGPPPADAAVRKQVEALQLRISQIEARRLVGDASGLAQSREIVAAAQKLGYRPLVAEALLGLGALEAPGEQSLARRAVADSAAAALGARDDVTATRAFTRLLRIDTYNGQFEDARLWGNMAGGSLDRLGGNDALAFALTTEMARLDRREGKVEESVQQFRRVLEHAQRLEPSPGTLTAGALHDLSTTLRVAGQLDEALDHERAGLRIVQAQFGEKHPRTALLHSGLGLILSALRRLPEAEAELRAALASSEAAFGPDHPNVGDDLLNLGQNMENQGRLEEAVQMAERALEIHRHKLGEKHPRVQYSLLLIGRVRWRRRDAKGAVPLLERALEASKGRSDPTNEAQVQLALARALWDAGLDRRRARTLGEEARAAFAAHAAKNPQPFNQEELAKVDAALASMR
jgi:tetratricopeptide (TPR) repeat protein